MANAPNHSLTATGVPLLVGREREQATLRAHLAAALAGQGSLVLVGGEVGIGKTSLAEALCREAMAQGACVLVGRCYDLTETPPYGPWVELLGRYRATDGAPPLPTAFAQPGTVGEVANQTALFQQVQAFFTRLSAQQPLVLLLDDLHWADPASLDLLRFLARSLAGAPLLLVVTYRADELTRHHPLYHLLPILVRESAATRLDLRPLDTDDLHALIAGRYHLSESDAVSLVAYLQARAEGNPFFMTELLRALEEERALTVGDDGWQLRALTDTRLPSLLRQVIDGRLARLGEDARQALAVAAVIGQEFRLADWATAAEVTEETVLAITDRAIEMHLLEETAHGAQARFAHALIREALYAGVPPSQRRRIHRRVAETLAASPTPDPDAVAHHFQHAGDRRAAEWLVRAGERAQRAYAWVSAIARYETAIALLDADGTDAQLRGWLHYRLARLRRFDDPRGGLAALTEAARMATEAADGWLAANVLAQQGFLHMVTGDFARGFPLLEAGIAALEREGAHEESPLAAQDTISAAHARSGLILWLPYAGRFAEARARGARYLVEEEEKEEVTGRGRGEIYTALAWAYAAEGKPAEAERFFAASNQRCHAAENHNRLGWAYLEELHLVALPYRADDQEACRRLATESAQAFARASATWADHPPRTAWLPLLTLMGDWGEAEALATAEHAAAHANFGYRITPDDALTRIARARGDTARTWGIVRDWLPDGPATPPGAVFYFAAVMMLRIAVGLALDADDRVVAKEWLEAHDRWLAWSGAVPGRAEGDVLWARYERAAGNTVAARERAIHALALATAPRQPLALLAAHRMLGALDTDTGRFADAEAHLNAALALADACAAPYERALALLARAELRHATGDAADAQSLLDEARSICTRLGAQPALAHADRIAAMLMTAPSAKTAYPAGLSMREVEVLRLVAAGLTNAQVAERLFLSPRTINAHLTTIYTKLNVPSRAAAIRFALDHGLS
ncbi:MAG: helix-turn-helix transcriptional regulator [Thermomicrobiales bacterium]